ncbi:MAG TPA: hypothetical protein PLE72_12530 [Azospira sp.]|nr:hypothetical protein [Azospira sp.]HNN47062.1 hypothetical protein [Azospira sp.]
MTKLERGVISLGVWIGCLPVLYFHFLFATLIPSTLRSSNSYGFDYFTAIAAACGALAWVILGIMDLTWISGRRLGKFFPMFGTALAAVGFAPFCWSILVMPNGSVAILWIVFALPAIILATYLVKWHTSKITENGA